MTVRILVFIRESRGCECSIAESLYILLERSIDWLETKIKRLLLAREHQTNNQWCGTDSKFKDTNVTTEWFKKSRSSWIVDYCTGISNICMCGHWFVANFYGKIVDNFFMVGNCVHSSVSVGHVYGHAKCALLPYKVKYSTLSVENKAQCGTLWNVEHTFPLWTYIKH